MPAKPIRALRRIRHELEVQRAFAADHHEQLHRSATRRTTNGRPPEDADHHRRGKDRAEYAIRLLERVLRDACRPDAADAEAREAMETDLGEG